MLWLLENKIINAFILWPLERLACIVTMIIISFDDESTLKRDFLCIEDRCLANEFSSLYSLHLASSNISSSSLLQNKEECSRSKSEYSETFTVNSRGKAYHFNGARLFVILKRLFSGCEFVFLLFLQFIIGIISALDRKRINTAR